MILNQVSKYIKKKILLYKTILHRNKAKILQIHTNHRMNPHTICEFNFFYFKSFLIINYQK